MNPEPLLAVRGLTKQFRGRAGATLLAVDDVSFDVAPGEAFGLVGETGSGKTTLARMIKGLERPSAGEVLFDGDLRRDAQMVFQDPQSSLNPRKTAGSIIASPLEIHGAAQGRAQRRRAVQELMELVGLDPEHYNRYPHEFSGGQRQRIGIARAIALRPKLVIADEPVSALDVSIQAQVLELLRGLRRDLGLALILISHDLAVVRHMCERVAVMRGGAIVELAGADELYRHPRHEYTRALMGAVPLPAPPARPR